MKISSGKNKKFLKKAGAFAIIIALVTVTISGTVGARRSIPDPNQSYIDLTEDSYPGMVTCPKGADHTEPQLEFLTYRYIAVILKDAADNPVQGIPASSVSIEVGTTGDTVWFGTFACVVTAVDAASDANGQIRFTIVGDTSINGNISIQARVMGMLINDIELLPCKSSFDLNIDGTVGLGDFVIFQSRFLTSDYQADSNWDGTVGLGDFVFFQAHFLHQYA